MRKVLMATVLMVAAAPAMAKSVEIKPTCTSVTCQQAFESMSKDLVATIDYKALGPAAATGVVSLGVGVVASYVPVKNSGDWNAVTGSDIKGLGMAGVQVTKGLPLNIDVGAFYSEVPSTSVKMYGGEVRYAILPGSTVSPAIAVRGSYVTITGIDSFKASTKGLDVSLSKGFPFLTPYIGAGYTWGVSDPDAKTGLKKVDVNKSKVYVGVRLSMGLFEVTPEVGKLGDNVTYALRAGLSFSL